MEVVKQNKHINIILTGPSSSGKMNVYVIFSKASGQRLGAISWFSPWRQYCFDPNGGTVWSSSCLNLVIEFLKEINKAHNGNSTSKI